MTYIEEIAKCLGLPETQVKLECRIHQYEYTYLLRVPYPPDPRLQKCIANWYSQQLPGCCGVLVSYHVGIVESYKGKGLGKILLRLRQKLAYDLGYTVLLCTNRTDNPVQAHLLTRAGFEQAALFQNRRTNNHVSIQYKLLARDYQELGCEITPNSPPKP